MVGDPQALEVVVEAAAVVQADQVVQAVHPVGQ